jgi:hypothetical protein
MGLFSSNSSDEPRCDAEDTEHMNYHEGPFQPTDELWYGKFEPEKQDDDYIYGYVEKENYARCEECGALVRHRGAAYPDKEFKKMPKEDVPEAKIEEVEVATDRLRYK